MNLNSILTHIDQWLGADRANYLTYMAVLFTLIIISLIVTAVLYRKIGGKDERTALIKLRISHITLGVGFASALFIMSSISTGTQYISQLGLIPVTITMLAGAIATLVFYIKNR